MNNSGLTINLKSGGKIPMKQDSFVLENYLTENNRFLLDAWPTRMKNDLDIVCFDNATILPWKSSKNSWGLGGVEDASEKFIDQSAYMNGWSKYGGEYKINEAPAEVDEYFVWMGIFVRQWGHFLLDCVNRLWCINDNMYKDLKVAYICDPSTEISGNYLRFLELLGVKKENIVKITKPTKVKKIYIPQLSFVKFEYYSVQYLKMFETVCRNSKSFEQWNGKDVYFTREAYSHGLKAKDFGLKTIKKNFAVNGFVCVEPQNLSLEEQISIWNNTRTVACINGSIPLNLLFCQNPHVNVVVCNKTNREHENLRIIESITNHRVLYVDVYDPKYTNKEFSLGQGPFLCTMTDQFKKYLSDHNMVYASESPIERIYAIIRFDLVCLYRFVKGD